MKNWMKVAAGFLLLVLVLVPALPASAQGLPGGTRDGKVIFGDDFVLKSGETLDGDLVVFGGNVRLESGSKVSGSMAVIGGNVQGEQDIIVDGDLVLVGGNLRMDGELTGDAVLIGGNLALGKSAVVAGDITTVGGTLQQDPGARVAGSINDESSTPTITIPDLPSVNIPDTPPVVIQPGVSRPEVKVNFNPFAGFLGTLGWAIAVALIAVVASLFLHPQMERVSSAIAFQPVIAGSFGLLGMVVSVLAITMMAITIILAPVSILASLVLLLAWLFGLVAIGQEVGDRLALQLKQSWTIPVSAGVGTLLLMVVVGILASLVPCAGAVAGALVGLAGFGGVILTYFGSRNYPTGAVVPVEVPPAS
jgi:cytoskeletal protein CcmA (bactofilin family)